MTLQRAMAPGPRTIALPGAIRFFVVLVVVAAGIVGCGTTGPSPSASATASAGALVADPSSGRWPGGTVLAVMALGAADAELEKAGVDLQAAVENQDLAAMRGAADGLATLIDKLAPQVERLADSPVTQPAAALYRKAFPELAAGARKLSDAITAGDSAGILAGSQQISGGLADYAVARRAIGPLVEQAILQQRLLVK